jgi:hypothetical protein
MQSRCAFAGCSHILNLGATGTDYESSNLGWSRVCLKPFLQELVAAPVVLVYAPPAAAEQKPAERIATASSVPDRTCCWCFRALFGWRAGKVLLP